MVNPVILGDQVDAPTMHTGAMLLTWIAEIAEEPFVLDPTGPIRQAQANTWSLRTDPDEETLTVDQVVTAFERTAETLRFRVCGDGLQATFYVWHDEQAGQLCCSLSSQGPDALPFSGTYTGADTLDSIVEQFLSQRHPGLVPWHELEPGVDKPAEKLDFPTLRVWTRRFA